MLYFIFNSLADIRIVRDQDDVATWKDIFGQWLWTGTTKQKIQWQRKQAPQEFTMRAMVRLLSDDAMKTKNTAMWCWGCHYLAWSQEAQTHG